MSETPLVSVILPTYNSSNTISNAIESIIQQKYTNWELIIIHDCYKNDPKTTKILDEFISKDHRIKKYEFENKQGLANALNYGMSVSSGKYIARIDADDTAHKNRFKKQVELLEKNKDVGVCGTWQKHISKKNSWIHKTSKTKEMCKANMIFWCNICHSTIMLRKEVFLENKLFYNPEYLQEDFELWGRAIEYTEFINIPKVLGYYSEGTGITKEKKGLNEESGKIVVKNIKQYFDVEVDEKNSKFFEFWNENEKKYSEEDLKILKKILIEIWKKNTEKNVLTDKTLFTSISTIWHSCKYGYSLYVRNPFSIKSIEAVFSEKTLFSLYFRTVNKLIYRK